MSTQSQPRKSSSSPFTRDVFMTNSKQKQLQQQAEQILNKNKQQNKTIEYNLNSLKAQVTDQSQPQGLSMQNLQTSNANIQTLTSPNDVASSTSQSSFTTFNKFNGANKKMNPKQQGYNNNIQKKIGSQSSTFNISNSDFNSINSFQQSFNNQGFNDSKISQNQDNQVPGNLVRSASTENTPKFKAQKYQDPYSFDLQNPFQTNFEKDSIPESLNLRTGFSFGHEMNDDEEKVKRSEPEPEQVKPSQFSPIKERSNKKRVSFCSPVIHCFSTDDNDIFNGISVQNLMDKQPQKSNLSAQSLTQLPSYLQPKSASVILSKPSTSPLRQSNILPQPIINNSQQHRSSFNASSESSYTSSTNNNINSIINTNNATINSNNTNLNYNNNNNAITNISNNINGINESLKNSNSNSLNNLINSKVNNNINSDFSNINRNSISNIKSTLNSNSNGINYTSNYGISSSINNANNNINTNNNGSSNINSISSLMNNKTNNINNNNIISQIQNSQQFESFAPDQKQLISDNQIIKPALTNTQNQSQQIQTKSVLQNSISNALVYPSSTYGSKQSIQINSVLASEKKIENSFDNGARLEEARKNLVKKESPVLSSLISSSTLKKTDSHEFIIPKEIVDSNLKKENVIQNRNIESPQAQNAVITTSQIDISSLINPVQSNQPEINKVGSVKDSNFFFVNRSESINHESIKFQNFVSSNQGNSSSIQNSIQGPYTSTTNQNMKDISSISSLVTTSSPPYRSSDQNTFGGSQFLATDNKQSLFQPINITSSIALEPNIFSPQESTASIRSSLNYNQIQNATNPTTSYFATTKNNNSNLTNQSSQNINYSASNNSQFNLDIYKVNVHQLDQNEKAQHRQELQNKFEGMKDSDCNINTVKFNLESLTNSTILQNNDSQKEDQTKKQCSSYTNSVIINLSGFAQNSPYSCQSNQNSSNTANNTRQSIDFTLRNEQELTPSEQFLQFITNNPKPCPKPSIIPNSSVNSSLNVTRKNSTHSNLKDSFISQSNFFPLNQEKQENINLNNSFDLHSNNFYNNAGLFSKQSSNNNSMQQSSQSIFGQTKEPKSPSRMTSSSFKTSATQLSGIVKKQNDLQANSQSKNKSFTNYNNNLNVQNSCGQSPTKQRLSMNPPQRESLNTSNQQKHTMQTESNVSVLKKANDNSRKLSNNLCNRKSSQQGNIKKDITSLYNIQKLAQCSKNTVSSNLNKSKDICDKDVQQLKNSSSQHCYTTN